MYSFKLSFFNVKFSFFLHHLELKEINKSSKYFVPLTIILYSDLKKYFRVSKTIIGQNCGVKSFKMPIVIILKNLVLPHETKKTELEHP